MPSLGQLPLLRGIAEVQLVLYGQVGSTSLEGLKVCPGRNNCLLAGTAFLKVIQGQTSNIIILSLYYILVLNLRAGLGVWLVKE